MSQWSPYIPIIPTCSQSSLLVPIVSTCPNPLPVPLKFWNLPILCNSNSLDVMAHFVRSFVINDSTNGSISVIEAERLDTSVLQYLLFWSCSFCSWSRTPSRTSATTVNLQTEHEHIQDCEIDWTVNQRQYIHPYHFWRSPKLVSTGPPMQASCCLYFHSRSSTSMRVATVSAVWFKSSTNCCSTVFQIHKKTIKLEK